MFVLVEWVMTSKLMKSIAFVALLGAASAALAAGLLDVSYRPIPLKNSVESAV